MSSLRKACRNCTASKRKCVVQLPKCIRCAQRGLECTYDLEHLSAPTGKPEELPNLSFNPSSCNSPGYCVFKPFQFRASQDPGICSPGHADSLEIIRWGYLAVPDLVKAGQPALFVHPKLQMHRNHNHFAIFSERGTGGMSHENFQRLVQIDVKTVPVEEALTALQALLLYLAALLFSSNPTEQVYAERFLEVLSNWTQTILLSAQARMSRKQSPWQEWLFGESVRRSIIMGYGLSMTLSSFKYGYCSNWLFLESLPLDSRPGLWMAQSPQAWITAAGASIGEEVGEQLSSLHEFAETVRESNINLYGDAFSTMLVHSHNGPRKKCEVRTNGN